jgi:hypothetical protein
VTIDQAPRFSFVLPVYQSDPGYLVAALRAIQAQRFPNWECQVVDDGSADGRPAAVVRAFAAGDARFCLGLEPTNAGIARTTNLAISRCRGDWVVFCDHDDLVHPEALLAISHHLALHPADDVIYTDEQMVDEHGVLIAEHRKPEFSPERLLGQNYLAHLVAVRRRLLRDLPLDPQFEPCQDNDLVLRATAAARSVGHVAQICYSWRAAGGSIAASPDRKSGVAAAVADAAAAHLERTSDTAEVHTIENSPTTVLIHRPWPLDVTVQHIDITPATATVEVDTALRRSGARFVVFSPELVPEHPHGDWVQPLLAQCVRDDVAAAGPRLVTTDHRLISAGRVHHPRVRDLLQGSPATNHGPWGAFLVARECASLAPWGLVIDREAALAAGGLPHEVDLDVAVAEMCTRLRLAGQRSIWSPLAELALGHSYLDDPTRIGRRDEQAAWRAGLLPELADDPYSPLGSFSRSDTS